MVQEPDSTEPLGVLNSVLLIVAAYALLIGLAGLLIGTLAGLHILLAAMGHILVGAAVAYALARRTRAARKSQANR